MPSPTRSQVRDLLFNAPFGTLTDDNVVTATVGDVVDAVMALLTEAPQPRVLWEGETYFLGSREKPNPDRSWFVPPYAFAVDGPPGTRVQVIEVPG